MHADGMGLYLKVKESGKKYWIYRYQDNKRRRDMSLGPCSIISLAEARDLAHEAYRKRRNGIDPLEEKVNEILGIEKQVEKVEKEFKPLVPRKEDDKKEDVDNDYKYSRENYYNLIERGQEAIQGILDVAKEGQHPRAYEVALAGIKNVADTVDKLQDLQAKLKELKQLPKTSNANIKNALFVGSTAELQKMLNRKKEDESIKSKNITPEKTDISD